MDWNGKCAEMNRSFRYWKVRQIANMQPLAAWALPCQREQLVIWPVTYHIISQ